MTPETLLTQLTNARSEAEFAECVMAFVAYLFGPGLSEGRLEDGTVVFQNTSGRALWSFLKWEHSQDVVPFVTINGAVTDELLARVFGGDRALTFVVAGSAPAPAQLERTYRMFNESSPRKAVLLLSGQDLKAMLGLKSNGQDPLTYIQTLYRGFRAAAQHDA